jgi:transposase InsO family protein
MRVSVSAYHAYAGGKTYVLSPRKVALAAQVKEIFYLHRRRYGARRIAAELKAQGERAGRCAVRALMQRQELTAIRPRSFVPRTTDSRHGVTSSQNLLLDEKNAPHGSREVIVGDITYLPLQTGKWGYLASWQDKFTKRVVGWAVESRISEELVIKAFT